MTSQEFVGEMEKGAFYRKKLQDLTSRPSMPAFADFTEVGQARLRAGREEELRLYTEKLKANTALIIELVVEALRYQNW